MIQDNPFADLIPQGAPQPMTPPAQQQTPGIIYGRPKQPDPMTVQRFAFDVAKDQRDQSRDSRRDALTEQTTALQNQVTQLTIADKRRQARLDEEADRKRAGLRDAEGAAARRVLTAIDRARGNVGFFSTGTPGQLLQGWGGTDARDLAAQLQTIKGNLGFDRLQQMRDMSPTGGALGQVAVQELEALQSTVASLDQAQSAEELSRGLDEVEQMYRDILSRFEVNSGQQSRERGDIEARPVALTGENIVDFMSGLSGGQYDINEDGSVNYNGQPVEVGAGIANSDEFRAAYQQKFGRLPPIQVDVEGGEVDPAAMATERGRGGLLETLDAGVRGIADTATLGMADEISAAGQTLFGGGTMAQNLQAERNVDRYDERNNFGARLTGQIAGGFALPVGGARTPGELARIGAAYGGGYGFGSTDGGIGDRLVGGAGGAAIGAGSAYGLARLGQAAAGRFGGGGGPGGGNAAGAELMAAAQRQGIDILPADVGGPMSRRFTAGAAQTPFGSGPVINAANRAQEQAGGRLAAIAGSEGAPLRQEALGELATGAAQSYIDRTGAAARRGYDQARELAGPAILRGQKAVESIDGQLSELAATANTDAPLINGLQRLRADLANEGGAKDLSIDAIRRLRTSTRAEAMSDGLRGTDYQRRAGQVLDALSEDIASQLPADAAAAFRRQDAAYRERLNTIDDVMENVIGRGGDRSAEAVANRLISMGRGDSARLRSFLNAVEPEEAGIVRGSLIQAMGRATKGQQDDTSQAFSLQTFLSNWADMPDRTKGLLFRGDNRKAIEDLARVASGARNTARFANTSNTAGSSNVSEIGRAISYGTGLSTMGLSMVAENLTGRLLASQRFGQWLARAPRDPARRETWVRRLGTIAAREPAIANDILPLQQALQQSIRSAAAEEAPANQPQNRR